VCIPYRVTITFEYTHCIHLVYLESAHCRGRARWGGATFSVPLCHECLKHQLQTDQQVNRCQHFRAILHRPLDLDSHLTRCSLGPPQVHNPNSMSISSAVFAGLMIVKDRPTDRPHYSICNNMPHLWFYVHNTAMQPKIPQKLHLLWKSVDCKMQNIFIYSKNAWNQWIDITTTKQNSTWVSFIYYCILKRLVHFNVRILLVISGDGNRRLELSSCC